MQKKKFRLCLRDPVSYRNVGKKQTWLKMVSTVASVNVPLSVFQYVSKISLRTHVIINALVEKPLRQNSSVETRVILVVYLS